jgi:chorismate mutase
MKKYLKLPYKSDRKKPLFIKSFDAQAYIEANLDVKNAIERGEFKDALHHLDVAGLEEIKKGLRPFHKDFQPFDEVAYLHSLQDKKYPSAFEHFCYIGYDEIIHHVRPWDCFVPIESDEPISINFFNEEMYIAGNDDVQSAIEANQFEDALHHLRIAGLEEIKKGVRPFHKDFEPFDEATYLQSFKEVAKLVKSKKYHSAFEHFCAIGYREIIEYSRRWKLRKDDNFLLVSTLSQQLSSIKNSFDFASYIEANPDIKDAIAEKKYKSILHHFELSGLKGIELGLRPFHRDFEPFNEDRYRQHFHDIDDAIRSHRYPSGFTHFCLRGYREIIEHKRPWDKVHNPPITTVKKTPTIIQPPKDGDREVFADIVSYDEGYIKGWFYCDTPCQFLLLVDGQICSIIERGIAMPDIAQEFNFPQNTIGFIAQVSCDCSMSHAIALYAIFENRCVELSLKYKPIIDKRVPSSLKILNDLKIIASQEDAVAIVVWDTSSQALEEAKTLYDTISDYRPVIIIGFNFALSKDEVWKPLETSKMHLLNLHWDEQALYREIIQDLKIHFQTVWICNPTLPSVLLADIFSNEDTKFILHHDGDDDTTWNTLAHLSKPYGLLGSRLAENIGNKISAHSYKNPSYTQLQRLESVASQQKKSDIFSIPLSSTPLQTDERLQPTLILCWKQPDSTLYGRRVDQVAKAYKERYPMHRVLIIETMNAQQQRYYDKHKDDYISDTPLQREGIRKKRFVGEIEGVKYALLDTNFFTREEHFRTFFLEHRLLPMNTLFVLFPILDNFDHFFNAIHGYTYMVDVVDNQLSWDTNHKEDIIRQYKILLKSAKYRIFNSKNNYQFFLNASLLEREDRYLLIPNWYLPPTDRLLIEQSTKIKDKHKIFYSGNMNDRVDWRLIETLLETLPKDTTLYLIGNAHNVQRELRDILLKHKHCQFLGPLDEKTLITFIEDALFAIIPHTNESISHYMNPIKVHMFEALKIDCISTHIAGLEGDFEYLTVCDTQEMFIQESLKRCEKSSLHKRRDPPKCIVNNAKERYIDIIFNHFHANDNDERS